MDKTLLLSKIATSKREVADAELRLSEVLAEMAHAPRAQKTTVTTTVREALSKLQAARTDLEELGRIVSGDDG